MSVRMRHTRAQTRDTRSHHAVKPTRFSKCPKCKADVLPHTLCLNCGTYNGREIIDVLAKLTKKERKQKEKELKEEDSRAKGKSLDAEALSKK